VSVPCVSTRSIEADLGLDADDHDKYITFHPAEVAVPPKLFAAILNRIVSLRLASASS
jgi:hypothetical protein